MPRTIPEKIKKSSKVVLQLDFVAVKEVTIPAHQQEGINGRGAFHFFNVPADTVYDIWSWNIVKQKWTRMSNTACGYPSLPRQTANGINNEIVNGLKAIGVSSWTVPPL